MSWYLRRSYKMLRKVRARPFQCFGPVGSRRNRPKLTHAVVRCCENGVLMGVRCSLICVRLYVFFVDWRSCLVWVDSLSHRMCVRSPLHITLCFISLACLTKHLGRASCVPPPRNTGAETHRTMTLIGRLTKPCPGCQTPVEKLGGCNQMLCLHCNTSFCWICMEEVDRGTFPVHFQVM